MTQTVDASILGAVMFEEPYSRQAEAIVESEPMIAPAHLEAEILSIATKRARRGIVSVEGARARWEFATQLPVRHVGLTGHAVAAFDLSLLLQQSSHDCLYLAVAIAEGAPLVTADRRLYDAAVAHGLAEHVRWVGDFG